VIEAAEPVRRNLGRTEEGRAWLAALPALVEAVLEDWSLTVDGEPFGDGSASWVAPVTTAHGEPAVLKVGWPHPEAREEAAGLRVWDGAGAVRLLRHDADRWALLVERCEPGTALHRAGLTPEAALTAGAEVLRELWSVAPPAPDDGTATFDELAAVTVPWAALVRERMDRHRPPFDRHLVDVGAGLLASLPTGPHRRVLLHGDANPGNLRSATRRPWLAIDAKPMVGDAGYDPSPLVLQIDPPPHDDASELRHRFALVGDVTGEDPARLAAWSLARIVESALWHWDRGDHDGAQNSMALARRLAEAAGV
jgi:streptomycin 6-kinase